MNSSLDHAGPVDSFDPFDNCARKLLETIPLVMRTIRGEIRNRRFPEFSLAQFRAMSFIGRHRGTSLSALADHLGLTLPAASRLVDGLVGAQCVNRTLDLEDRRKILLDLTRSGGKRYGAASDSARRLLAQRLGSLAAEELPALVRALDRLAGLFQHEEPGLPPLPTTRARPRKPVPPVRKETADRAPGKKN